MTLPIGNSLGRSRLLIYNRHISSPRSSIPPSEEDWINGSRSVGMRDQRATRLGCAEFREQLRVSRRSFLQAGVLGAAGLSLADLLRFQAGAAETGAGPTHPHS